jgi:predicted transcriptional regulator
MIYERLKPLDVSLPNPADAAINAVSTVLNRMADKGSLTIVEKGKGRRPSTYRLAANDGLSEKEVNSEEKTS